MTFPAQAMQILVELQVGEGGTWVDVTEDLRMSSGVDISRGRQDEASEVNPGKCTLVLNNRHGKYSEFNPDGPYYGRLTKNTPIRVSVAPFGDGVYYPRFAGEVSKWPPRWDISDTDVWVPIEAAGILRRLRASDARPISAHQRYILANNPLTYWPLTDGEDAIEGKQGVGPTALRPFLLFDGDPISLYGNQPEWGKGDIASWMDPVVQFPRLHFLSGNVATSVGTTWTIQWLQSGYDGNVDNVSWYFTCRDDSDPNRFLVLQEQSSDRFAIGIQNNAVPIPDLVVEVFGPGIFDSQPHLIQFGITPNGGSLDWSLYIDGVSKGSGTYAAAAQPLEKVEFDMVGTPDIAPSLMLGHVAIFGESAPLGDLAYKAMRGYDGELAGRRIERLCQEMGITLMVQGDLDLTQPCGPQQMEGYMDLLQSAADVDGGTLGESTEDLALLYRTQRSKYNQGSVL